MSLLDFGGGGKKLRRGNAPTHEGKGRAVKYNDPQWHQLYGQPKIHKPGDPIRPVVAFCNTPLSTLHKVLAHYLKPLVHNSIRLNDFKQHLTSTGLPYHPYHCFLNITLHLAPVT